MIEIIAFFIIVIIAFRLTHGSNDEEKALEKKRMNFQKYQNWEKTRLQELLQDTQMTK